jgi:microcystin-dependent protein
LYCAPGYFPVEKLKEEIHMSDQFLAEIRIFPFNFAPRGWAQCNGQILSISQNTALFSLLGTNYGGNGTSNFGLPNFQGNAPIHQGQGTGLSPYAVGETGGTPTVTLLGNQAPGHSHTFSGDPTAKKEVTGIANAAPAGAQNPAYSTAAPNTPMSPTMLVPAGGGLPHDNMQPYLTLNFCIATGGIYPPRG